MKQRKTMPVTRAKMTSNLSPRARFADRPWTSAVIVGREITFDSLETTAARDECGKRIRSIGCSPRVCRQRRSMDTARGSPPSPRPSTFALLLSDRSGFPRSKGRFPVEHERTSTSLGVQDRSTETPIRFRCTELLIEGSPKKDPNE